MTRRYTGEQARALRVAASAGPDRTWTLSRRADGPSDAAVVELLAAAPDLCRTIEALEAERDARDIRVRDEVLRNAVVELVTMMRLAETPPPCRGGLLMAADWLAVQAGATSVLDDADAVTDSGDPTGKP